MKKSERVQILYEAIKKENILTTKEFLDYAKSLNIKYLTATRDLQQLIADNLIVIKFGRIEVVGEICEGYSREYQSVQNVPEKKSISEEARNFLEERETIFVSPGTTCEWFVKSINKPVEMVVTNGLEVFHKCLANENIQDVVLIGGHYRKNSHAFIGSDAMELLSNYRFSKSFLTASSIQINSKLLFNSNEGEANIFLSALKQSKESFLLIDSSKFEEDYGVRKITLLSNLSHVITDNLLDHQTIELIKETVDVVVANVKK